LTLFLGDCHFTEIVQIIEVFLSISQSAFLEGVFDVFLCFVYSYIKLKLHLFLRPNKEVQKYTCLDRVEAKQSKPRMI